MPSIDPTFLQYVSALKDALTAMSALTVATIAIVGYNRWQAELKGRAKFELGRRIVLLAIQFREEMAEARGPWTWPSESEKRSKSPSEAPEQSTTLDEYYSRLNRTNVPRQTLSKLREAGWEATILFNEGDAIEAAIRTLVTSLNRLTSSTHQHFQWQLHR
jgi:hypothetical protein